MAALLAGCAKPVPQPTVFVDMVRTADNKSARGNAGYDMAQADCNDAARYRAVQYTLLAGPFDDVAQVGMDAFVQCMRGAGWAAAYSNAEADQLKARHAP